MQAKTLIVVIILLSMFSILLTAGSKKEDVIEEMYGTWVNSLYNGRGYRNKRAKIIINSDGTIDKYNSEIDQSVRMTKPLKKSTVPNDTYSFYIEDSWIDQEKDSWYKVTCSNNLNEMHYELWKLSNTGKTWESVLDHNIYPTQIDTKHPEYHILYRYEKKSSEKIYNTWINPANNGRGKYYPAKYIYNPDGTWIKYTYIKEPDNSFGCGRGTITLTDKWTDSEGNIWYKGTWYNVSGYCGYILFMISKSGKTLERVWNYDHQGYPTEIDKKHWIYGTYYRK